MYIVIALLVIVIGVFLEVTLGGGFIFSYASEYSLVMLPVFVALIPVAWVRWSRSKGAMNNLMERIPTKWVRAIVFPLSVTFSALALVISPLGWLAVYGWAMGTTAQILPAQIVSIGHFNPQARGCNQTAKVTVGGITGSICIANRLVGQTPNPGQAVTVVARQSSIGYFVSEVRSK
jgi:hypothetical protein